MEKLIKLSDTHYIVVDDSEIKEEQWYCNNKVLFLSDSEFDEGNNPNQNKNNKLVTHSTQPLNTNFNDWFDVKIITIDEVEEAINGYSVEKIAEPINKEFGEDCEYWYYKKGFKAHQELVKDKLFTVEEAVEFTMKMLAQYIQGNTNIWNRQLLEESIKNSMVLKTEWNIKFDENGKIKLI